MELAGREFCAVKRAVFTRSKLLGLWLPALRETTTPTGAPPDEYERPDDLREISINRLEARSASTATLSTSSSSSSEGHPHLLSSTASTGGGSVASSSSSETAAVTTIETTSTSNATTADFSVIPFAERLRVSVFGQLVENIRHWDERSLRRSFVHMQDAGQARAFFVKFTGEGVDDHGGPYRAGKPIIACLFLPFIPHPIPFYPFYLILSYPIDA